MANQRYYITCPVCRKVIILGKSLGGGIYQTTDNDKLESIYDWMWKHMISCHEDETREGILFTIESDRI